MKPDSPEPSGTPSNLLAEIEALQQLIAAQATVARTQLDRLADLEKRLDATQAESSARLARLQELDAEQRAMKASRCWRWTAWLRSIERTLGRRGQR